MRALVALVLFVVALVLWNIATHGAVRDNLPVGGSGAARLRPAGPVGPAP